MHSLKLKYSTLLYWLVCLVILLDFPWDRLFSVPTSIYSINSTIAKLVILGISVLAFLLVVQKFGCVLTKYSFTSKFVCLTYAVALFVIICSTLIYEQQTILRTFKLGHQFFLIILAPCLLAVYENKKGLSKIIKLLNLYSLSWYLILILQSIVYLRSGNIFMGGINTEWTGFLNTGFLRISMIAVPNFMLVYNFSLVLEKRARAINFILLLLGIYCLLFVQQTRAYDVVIAGCFIAMYIAGSKNPTYALRNIIVVLMAAFVVYQTPYVQSLVGSFSSSSITAKTASNTNRLYAYSYYWDCFLKNPLFGSGLAAPEKYPTVTGGALGVASYSDCGIVAIAAQLGIGGLLIYALYVGRMIFITFKMAKKGMLTNNTFVIGITCYCILTAISLINMTVAFIILFPLCLSIMEYIYSTCYRNDCDWRLVNGRKCRNSGFWGANQ